MSQEHDFGTVLSSAIEELDKGDKSGLRAAGERLDQFGSSLRGMGVPERIARAAVSEMTRAAYERAGGFKVIVGSNRQLPGYKALGDHEYAVERPEARAGSPRIFHFRSCNTVPGEG